jgi:hypothetical protein
MTTKQTDIKKDLRDFFERHLVPVADVCRERNIEFFPLGPDAGAVTYFIDRNDDGNYVREIDSDDIADELEQMWSDLPELAAIVRPLMELAETLQEKEETADEISPFIYAMF